MNACTHTIGRRYGEDNDSVLDPFQKDYLAIQESPAYGRIFYKTQAMPISENSHVRTRGTHTNKTIPIAVKIAKELEYNPNPCMSIGAGHDIGHPPYGHEGERILTKLGGYRPFRHNIFSVVILQQIENDGKGLNCSYETLDGILKHLKGKGNPNDPEEYEIFANADKIEYTFVDFEDAIKNNYISKDEIPDFAYKLGRTAKERQNNCINALILESKRKGRVVFSEGPAFEDFKMQLKFNTEAIYPRMDSSSHMNDLERICEYFYHDPDFSGVDIILAVSLLTDFEVDHLISLLHRYKKPSRAQITDYGVFELLPILQGRKIDYTDPDLEWGEEKMRASAAKTPPLP